MHLHKTGFTSSLPFPQEGKLGHKVDPGLDTRALSVNAERRPIWGMPSCQTKDLPITDLKQILLLWIICKYVFGSNKHICGNGTQYCAGACEWLEEGSNMGGKAKEGQQWNKTPHCLQQNQGNQDVLGTWVWPYALPWHDVTWVNLIASKCIITAQPLRNHMRRFWYKSGHLRWHCSCNFESGKHSNYGIIWEFLPSGLKIVFSQSNSILRHENLIVLG